LYLPMFAHFAQLALEPRDAFLDAPAIDFELCLTGTPRADAAALPRQVLPHPREARQQILKLRQLDLQPALAAARALREDVEDELCAIEDFARGELFEVASLRGRQLVVENHGRDALLTAFLRDLFGLSFADVIGLGRLSEPLRDRSDNFLAGRRRKLGV